jgi:acyl transferase domain-containing protein
LLHPLLHQNVSDLSEQKYTSVFTGKEGFLSHHKVAGEKMFPGVAYLELAREAGERSIHQSITQLIDVTWLNSVRVNGQPQEVHTSVFEEGSGLGYEIYSKGEAGEEVIHGQGSLSTKTLTLAEAKDIASIQSRLTGERSGEECYRLFRSLGLDYGTTFRGIGTLYYSKQEALSKLTLPKQEDYVLQPGLLDSALQTCLGISLASGKEAKQLLLPFSVKEVNIYGAVGETRWAYARRRKGHQAEERVAHYDIDMLSQEGEVLVSFQDFVMLAVGSSEPNGTGKSRTEVAELSSKSVEENLSINADEYDRLKTVATNYLRSIFSKVLKLPESRLELSQPFEKYGIDSILVTRLTNRLSEVFEGLPVTLFFECQNLKEVIDYFIEVYPSVLMKVTGVEKGKEKTLSDRQSTVFEGSNRIRRRRLRASLSDQSSNSAVTFNERIAIIGLSGRI